MGIVNVDGNTEIGVAIERCDVREQSIRAQIEDWTGWVSEMRLRLDNLKREAKFHSLQRKLDEARKARNRFEEVKRAFEYLVSFGESVSAIHAAVEAGLTERLEEGVVGVSEKLSQVFSALTRHSWFDRLDLDKSKLPRLELRVSSSRDPLSIRHPIDVLNGQAESALDLVPYFAFSQTDDAPTEVYMVLLDDPTRAFDEDHIEILVERLAELGRHVQLVVASQETGRFRALLRQHFKPEEYAIVEPKEWSFQGGPRLSVERADTK